MSVLYLVREYFEYHTEDFLRIQLIILVVTLSTKVHHVTRVRYDYDP